jgi:N-terminal domain of anti-restriction factor ArdC
MSTTLHPTERRARKRTRYQGRSYAKSYRGPKPERGPSKRVEAAESALNEILALFESGDLPARIAETVIARAEGEAPMATWSLANQLLCLLSGTSDARGYKQWKEVGRHVKKGAKCVRILAPRTRTITETDADTGEESKRSFVSGFLAVPVFGLEDTEGLPLDRYSDYRPATFPPLFDVAESLGVRVDYAPFARSFRGYYSPGDDRIMLCTHDVRTFFHELAHAAHGRVLRARGESLTNGQVPRQEIVAETVAAVLCRLYDVETGSLAHSADYLRHYSKRGPAVAAMKVLGDVQAVLEVILEAAEVPQAVAA